MKYIDIEKLRGLSREEFQMTKPYPHYTTEGLLTEQGFLDLLNNLPPLDSFQDEFGKERRSGQVPHDRHSLEYTRDTKVPQPWKEFIDELCSDAYRQEVERLLCARKVEFRFFWHYTPSGCGVSPHSDSRRKHGTHLFYFNSEDDWRPEWGGSTLLLDDGGRFGYDAAPALEDFDSIEEIPCIGNFSSLMIRSDRAWHAVRPIQCPEGKLRKLFMVVVNPDSMLWKLRDRILRIPKQRF